MKPDFSGEYVLNRQTSTLSSGAAAIETAVMRVDHAEPTFRYQARFVAGEKAFEYSVEHASDGREVAVGEDEVSSLRWDGDALVAVYLTRKPDSEVTMSWRYELLDDGHILRAIEQIRGA